jgi:Zn finger protein HypA/HybF involved in hydrogenase expression
MSSGAATYRVLKQVWHAIVDPLRVDESDETFTLSIPEAQTTTVDSVQGWSKRPPAVLRCSGCGASIPQRRASNNIDCPNCYREFKPDEFADLELLGLYCPRCRTDMQHGIRHPMLFEIPEWATCPDCQYHWDLDHWFRRRKRR